MEIIEKKLSELKPYENNPRKNDGAVEYVANSIKEFGFKNPIIIDQGGEIIAGHTRYKAAKVLGLKTVPCIMADDLTEEQVKAFRLADNQTASIAEWDMPKLDLELESILEINMDNFGFDLAGEQNSNCDGKDTTDNQELSQTLHQGGEIDPENYADEKFGCTCPKCGFKFNPGE